MTLSKAVKYLDHGVRWSSQKDLKSKTLVCYLDSDEGFHYGFCYKNGSNIRVVVWEDDEKKTRTVPAGFFVIVFESVVTSKSVDDKSFTEDDFDFSWFTESEQELVENELLSRKNEPDMDELEKKMSTLSSG